MKIEQLQLIERNETTNLIFKLLSKSRTISNETNLISFKNFLMKKGYPIESTDYYNLFKSLNDAGVGYFDKSNSNVFIWNYSFQDVSEQILYPNKKVELRHMEEDRTEEKDSIVMVDRSFIEPKERKEEVMLEPVKRRGRPPGVKNKNHQKDEVPKLAAIRRPGRPPQSRIPLKSKKKEVVFVFTTSEGQMVALNLEDAEKLSNQVNQIKQNL